MTLFLDRIRSSCASAPDAVAFASSDGQTLTYGQLASRSDALACWLDAHGLRGSAVAFLAHKEPDVLSVMVGCMKAGCCYVPLDTSYPIQRVDNILAQLGRPLLVEVAPGALDALVAEAAADGEARAAKADAPEDRAPEARAAALDRLAPQRLEFPELADVLAARDACPDPAWQLGPDDDHYILFTSGSTGEPKGVVMPARAIDATCRYFERFIPEAPKTSSALATLTAPTVPAAPTAPAAPAAPTAPTPLTPIRCSSTGRRSRSI